MTLRGKSARKGDHVARAEIGRGDVGVNAAFAFQHPAVEGKLLDIKFRSAVLDYDLARHFCGESAAHVVRQTRIVHVGGSRTREKTDEEGDGEIQKSAPPAETCEENANRRRKKQRYQSVKMGYRIKRFGGEYACRQEKRKEADGSAVEDPSAAHGHFV